MELKHDWKTLNSLLFSQEKAVNKTKASFLLERGDQLIQGRVSDGKKIKGLKTSNQNLENILKENDLSKSYVIHEKDLDGWIQDACRFGPNYYEQMCFLQDQIKNERKTDLIFTRSHFFLDLFNKKLARFLPTHHLVLLYVDQRSSLEQWSGFSSSFVKTGESKAHFKAVLLEFKDNKLDQFFEPDFSSLHEGRLGEWQNNIEEINSYLENRYLLPVLSVFLYRDIWESMNKVQSSKPNKQPNPWRQFTHYIDTGRAEVYPRKFFIKAFLASQRILSYFGREL